METLHLCIKYEPRYAYHAFGKAITVEFDQGTVSYKRSWKIYRKLSFLRKCRDAF